MPTYSYACTVCDHRFDAQQAFSDAALTECPECAGRLRKLFGNVGVVFKGSGFYRTDARKDGKGSSSSGSSSSASSSSGSSSSEKSSSTTSTPAPATAGAAASSGGSSSGGSSSGASSSGAGATAAR